MNTKKNISHCSTYEFIEHSKQVIDKQILSFSEDKIDKLLVEIHTFAQGKGVDENYIVTRVLDYVNEKKAYYYNRQHQSYNYDVLKYVILWLCIFIILGLLLYFIIVYYDFPKTKELDDLIKRLEPFGITLAKRSKRVYRHTDYYLDVLIRKDLRQAEYIIAKNIFKQACEIHGEIYGWIRWSLIITGIFIFMVIEKLFGHIRSWFRPCYKQRFKTLVFIEQRLRQVEESWFENMCDTSLLKVKRKNR